MKKKKELKKIQRERGIDRERARRHAKWIELKTQFNYELNWRLNETKVNFIRKNGWKFDKHTLCLCDCATLTQDEWMAKMWKKKRKNSRMVLLKNFWLKHLNILGLLFRERWEQKKKFNFDTLLINLSFFEKASFIHFLLVLICLFRFISALVLSIEFLCVTEINNIMSMSIGKDVKWLFITFFSVLRLLTHWHFLSLTLFVYAVVAVAC